MNSTNFTSNDFNKWFNSLSIQEQKRYVQDLSTPQKENQTKCNYKEVYY